MARFDSFGGGLARGIQAGSQTALQGLSLAQQRKKMLAEQQQEQITRFNAIGDKTLEAVQQLVEGAASRGLDPRSPEVKAAIDQIVEPTVNTLTQARANGIPARDPEMLRRQINALQFGTPSQQESLAGTRATSQAQAEGTAAGTPNKLDSVPAFKEGQGRFQAFIDRETGQMFRRVALPDGTITLAEAPVGTVEVGTTVTGTAEEALPGVRPGEKERQKAGEEARDMVTRIQTITNLLQQANSLGPGVTGLSGLIGETGGGLVSQLNENLGEALTLAATGVSQEELTQFRSDAQRAIAQSIPETTGEESGRFTEQERRVAQQTLAVRSPGASFDQVVGALKAAANFAILNQDKKRQIAGIEPEFDLSTNEGVEKAAAKFLDAGYSVAQAADLINRLQAQREELSRFGADELQERFGSGE